MRAPLVAQWQPGLLVQSMQRLVRIILGSFLAASSMAVHAQEVEVPYWASIRAEEVNMRVGPSPNYQIAWVYKRPHLPLKVLRIKEGWRFVEDPDGAKGWVVARFLSRDRGAIVKGKDVAQMRSQPEASAPVLWNVEPGVVGQLGTCEANWCQLEVKGRSGWIAQSSLWGAGEP